MQTEILIHSIKPFLSYKSLSKLVESESYEPMLSWGIRMTFAVVVPLFYALYFNQMKEAMWVIVAAESIGWVELKGSFAQRVRVLLGGALLAILFGFAGSISSNNLALSLLLMLAVVFIATLFKNLGERGSSLSLTVYVMFIMANAYPLSGWEDIAYRCANIGIGGLWSLVVGVVASLFMSEQTPYKRSVAFIWKSTAELAAAIDAGWDGKGTKASVRDIYLKEKAVNATIENSLQLYEKRAYHNNHESKNAHQMAQLRKSVYLIGGSLMSLYDELNSISGNKLNGEQQQSIHAILKSIQIICERMTIYTVSSKTEEEMLLRSRIQRLRNMVALLSESNRKHHHLKSIDKIIHITERIIKLSENSIQHIMSVSSDQKVYRSYSLMKTLLILHHKHWIDNIRRMANINTHSFRYAIRTAIVATFALFISKWFTIPYGYWLPFTVMIVVQPYFGATLKKALDRVLGTILGVVIGGLLMSLPPEFHLKEMLLIGCPVLMVYFLRTNYSVATFFISVFLVALFAAEQHLDNSVILTRALCTLGGASLAVVGEFALLPTWDRDWLPRHIAAMIHANYNYFIFTFYPNNFSSAYQWTHYRRMAESSNSNAFDSFNRYIEEPTTKPKDYTIFYQLISHGIRITRELNNYHLEMDDALKTKSNQYFQQQKQKIADCLEHFNEIEQHLESLSVKPDSKEQQNIYQQEKPSFIPMNEAQSICLDKLFVELNAFSRDMKKWSQKFNERIE